MKHLLTAAALCSLLFATACGRHGCCQPQEEHLSDYVSTLVGTESTRDFSNGNTYPATAVPWGMNFWTPQTAKAGDGWVYGYNDHRINAFKLTHQPSVWINDYGCMSLMPITGPKFDGQGGDRSPSWFSHKTETARPYYYKVYLADHDVTVEIAPTERAAVMRFTFPESDDARILIDAFKGEAIESFDAAANMVKGYTTFNHGGVPEGFKSWFVIESDTPVEAVADEADSRYGELRLSTVRGQQVTVRIASSFISGEQAVRNLAEVGGRSLEDVRDAAQAAWDEALGRIRVSGGSTDQMRTFYSCLYRSLLFPHKFYEIDAEGNPYHYSPYNGEIRPGYLYTDTGFWDTFRALLPLVNLVYADTGAEMLAGLANVARESDFLPEWASPGHRGCMIGNNSASVVADAVMMGIPVSDEDMDVLWRAIEYATENVHPTIGSVGRLGHQYYNSLGYIPYNVGINENVARTLEYAYDDWAILQLAGKLGHPQAELDKWAARSQNFRNVYDPSTRLMRGRNEDGSFQEPFSPYKWGDAYTEGNAWHYTWSVFHDPQGLIDLMGGEESFTEMLDSVFKVPPIYDGSYYAWAAFDGRIHEITEMQVANMGNYAHGNQPAQHMLYLYDWAGQPWKTQYWVRQAMDRLYNCGPQGYCGDEDTGQTSAWYVFSALGFYPVCPAANQYAVGTPLFRHAQVTLADGTVFKIDADGNGPSSPYISSMKLNGRKWSHNYIDAADLKAGAKIGFTMSAEPALGRGTAAQDKPYSYSAAK